MIIPYQGKAPRIAATAFVAPTAVIIGDVTIGERVSVWFGAVLRGDVGHIEVGAGTGIQDNAVIHTTPDRPTLIGEEVTIGHGAVLEGCTLERRALIGMNAVILRDAVIGAESLIAAGSVVTDGTHIPPRRVAAGSPAKVRKELSGSSLEWVETTAEHYQRLARTYLDQGIGRPPGA